MQKILVSIVSTQTIPNVLFINDAKDVDQYLFICTDAVVGELENIKKAAALPDNQCRLVKVKPYDIKYIHEQLDQLKLRKKDIYEVNVTGGTKLMSLGVFQYFTSFNAKIFYLPIRANAMQEIHPKVGKEVPLLYHIGIKEYLLSYGFEWYQSSKNSHLNLNNEVYTNQFFLAHTNIMSGKEHNLIKSLRKSFFDKKEKYIETAKIKNLSLFLNQFRFPSKVKGQLQAFEKIYLTGGWFEEYVYHILKTALQLPDEQIACGVTIKLDGIRNEFDVMFTYKNELFVIECKTGLSNFDHFAQAVYKLSALDEKLGVKVKSYLITLSNYHHKKGYVKPKFAKRAAHHQVNLIDRTMILQQNGLQKLIEKIR